jgi:hypothetical protein
MPHPCFTLLVIHKTSLSQQQQQHQQHHLTGKDSQNAQNDSRESEEIEEFCDQTESFRANLPLWILRYSQLLSQFGGFFPSIRCNGTPYGTRWPYGSQPLHLCHFSGSSRASHHTKMSIQRLAPSIPPAISAGILPAMQYFCI